MAEEIFGENNNKNNRYNNANGRASETAIRRRRGNHYAHFTRKFSLGNGPADWVQEYLISKEGGKMLGTLVALAVARMRSLETFVWDMPTGVLRDVWLALSSLGDRDDGLPCRLERIWIRYHDNSASESAYPLPRPPTDPVTGLFLHPGATANTATSQWRSVVDPHSLDRVEYPSFSILPPLKSLSVLEIDELPYLDEMAVLIGRSRAVLRELRVGLAFRAMPREWLTMWEGSGVQQVDYADVARSSLTLGEKRLGGVLGVLLGCVWDMRREEGARGSSRRRRGSKRLHETAVVETADSSSADSAHPPPDSTTQAEGNDNPSTVPVLPHPPADTTPTAPNEPLNLTTLALECIPLFYPLLSKALNWTTLTSLTILSCPQQENLWKSLRRAFAPTPKSPLSSPRASRQKAPTQQQLSYPLSLKRFHNDSLTPAVLAFLTQTLAPNSLEVLFLQEHRGMVSTVTPEMILKGPLRRHRLALRKVLIESCEKETDGSLVASNRYRRLVLGREVLAFLVGGKVPKLRELGCCLEYRDWHFFLQHLPHVPHLRSLSLPYVADHIHGPDADPRELAMQVVDIVSLRPEIELCYLGIGAKCFEILENRDAGASTIEEEEDDEEEDDEDDDEDEEEMESESEDDSEEESVDADSEAESESVEEANAGANAASRLATRLRLREILFYDDKVDVFRARHGRL